MSAANSNSEIFCNRKRKMVKLDIDIVSLKAKTNEKICLKQFENKHFFSPFTGKVEAHGGFLNYISIPYSYANGAASAMVCINIVIPAIRIICSIISPQRWPSHIQNKIMVPQSTQEINRLNPHKAGKFNIPNAYGVHSTQTLSPKSGLHNVNG